MTNYLQKYSNNTPKFQEGGAMPAQGGAPQGPDPEAMLQEYAQAPSPELAVAIADALVAMMAGGAPAGPEGQPMPAQRNGGRMKAAPKFREGGKLK